MGHLNGFQQVVFVQTNKPLPLWFSGSPMGKALIWYQKLSVLSVLYLQREKNLDAYRTIFQTFPSVAHAVSCLANKSAENVTANRRRTNMFF